MKRICLIICVLLSLTSCGKKKSATAIEDSIPEHDFISEVVIPAAAQAAKAKVTAQSVSVVMLWEPNGALWAEDENGIMQWGKYDIPTGQELEGICDESGEIERKKAKRNSMGKLEERDFVHVRYDGKELWVQEGMVAVNAKPAVVCAENTLVYNTPTITGMGSKVLAVGTVVAVSNEEVQDKNFVKIDALLTSDYIRGRYIKADKIVTNSDDVQVLQLITLAKNSKNETVRNELLVNAKALKPSDTVAKMLADYEAELAAKEESEAVEASNEAEVQVEESNEAESEESEISEEQSAE